LIIFGGGILPKFRILLLFAGILLITACADNYTPAMALVEVEHETPPILPEEPQETAEFRQLFALLSEYVSAFNETISAEMQEITTIYNAVIIECETELMKAYEEIKEIEEIRVVRSPMVALTFDDGPSYLTDILLDILEEHDAKATFFVLGNRVENWQETVQRMVENGNEIAGHSWNHQNFTRLSEAAITSQILDTSAAIERVTGFPPPPIFRAPYGALNHTTRRVAYNLGYGMVNWTMDALDWQYRDASIIHARIMRYVINGSVVVMHDIHHATIEAMRQTIPALIEQGYMLVTITELLDYFYGGILPGGEHRGLRPGETERAATPHL